MIESPIRGSDSKYRRPRNTCLKDEVALIIGCPDEIRRRGDLSPFDPSVRCITSENLDQPSRGLEVGINKDQCLAYATHSIIPHNTRRSLIIRVTCPLTLISKLEVEVIPSSDQDHL